MFPYSKKEKCNHRWDVKCDKLVPSFIERVRPSKMDRMALEMSQSTHVLVMACIRCGKIDKTITKC